MNLRESEAYFLVYTTAHDAAAAPLAASYKLRLKKEKKSRI